MGALVLFERDYRLRFWGRRGDYFCSHGYGGAEAWEFNGLEMQRRDHSAGIKCVMSGKSSTAEGETAGGSRNSAAGTRTHTPHLSAPLRAGGTAWMELDKERSG
jgi:hypothetical protein